MDKVPDSQNPLLSEALTYTRWGWSIIPIRFRGKEPAVRSWKTYQSQPPVESQVQRWFSTNWKNIAVILGPVSGGLACRDFDKIEAYRQWVKKHPQLAKTLPIVKTSRGAHVYFINREFSGIRHFDDGELRGAGGYCLLPPSIHPDGTEYEWQNTPGGSIPEVDPDTAGMIGAVTEHTEQTEYTEINRAITGNEEVLRLFKKTLPVEFGTRNRKIFAFARELKSLPEFSEIDPMRLKYIFQEWHRRALPKIKTKEFTESWIDFLKAWQRIQFSVGESKMTQVVEKARCSPIPPIALEKFPESPDLQRFIRLCRELQREAGNGGFFLSCRKAAELFEVKPMQIHRWFFLLESEGVIRTLEKGGTAKNPRKASRYKYLGN